MLPWILDLGQSIETDQRPDKKSRQDFIGEGGGENKQQVPFLAHSLRGGKLFLKWGEGRGVSRSPGRRGGLGVLLTSQVVVYAGAGAVAHLLQAPQKWQLGFFGLFVSFGSGVCPNCSMETVIFCLIQFLCICCQRRNVSGMVFIDVSSAPV